MPVFKVLFLFCFFAIFSIFMSAWQSPSPCEFWLITATASQSTCTWYSMNQAMWKWAVPIPVSLTTWRVNWCSGSSFLTHCLGYLFHGSINSKVFPYYFRLKLGVPSSWKLNWLPFSTMSPYYSIWHRDNAPTVFLTLRTQLSKCRLSIFLRYQKNRDTKYFWRN